MASNSTIFSTNADNIQVLANLAPYVTCNDKISRNTRIRGLIIIPGGGGKTTLLSSLYTKVACADIDDYWDQEQEQNRIQELTVDWKEACTNNNLTKRHQIEDEYVLLKAKLSKQKWSHDEMYDLLFVQTYAQASVLLDENCFALNLLPTARLHHSNLYRRAKSEHPPQDFDVCLTQWKENELYSHVLYDTFEQLEKIVTLFHQFISSNRN
ncbi:unnamed protein product [Didymodactylos carnosus]|uniref:Uncharacterized protein n=1 Tax=Didymodactylos carnosus TaxID=1234261 RepID=A0A814VEP9_9BILA|nr:unnamed protein product [Didymodactylos carnosus]CAF1184404.1 unnamed protein product [Didymodactylos carnosus]CAF3816538.1 unnamed protein product [Didymodactylos carnosus]CAF3948761.1 unnamed protein product [Didymodactylos carnosus]